MVLHLENFYLRTSVCAYMGAVKISLDFINFVPPTTVRAKNTSEPQNQFVVSVQMR